MRNSNSPENQILETADAETLHAELERVRGLLNSKCAELANAIDRIVFLQRRESEAFEVIDHILAMENDVYFQGHPEWEEIVAEASTWKRLQ